MVPLSCRIKK